MATVRPFGVLLLVLGQDRDRVGVLYTDDLAGPCPREGWEQEQGEKENECLGFWHVC